mmetsp:Transcript_45373/g.85119  ORF Transcript_45373/g.85119 Transcript_45373/m.85119 type:complete len:99 (+) Transcript_45373:782-1078(+)
MVCGNNCRQVENHYQRKVLPSMHCFMMKGAPQGVEMATMAAVCLLVKLRCMSATTSTTKSLHQMLIMRGASLLSFNGAFLVSRRDAAAYMIIMCCKSA